MLDSLLVRISDNDRWRRWLTPLLRSYIRYAPFLAGKEPLWRRVISPYLAWHSYPFVAPTSFGSRMVGDTLDVIQQHIYYFGIFEPNLTRWIGRRLGSGDTFVDVGANIGYMTLLASRCVGPAGTVVAIEASPTTFQCLQQNLALNGAKNVRAVNVAVSDMAGVVKLYRGPEHNVGMTGMFDEQEGFKLDFQCEVEAAPLDSILTAEEMRGARLIKIDVEGAEWAVIAGMATMLRSGRPDLEVIVEVHPELLAQQGKKPDDLVGVLRDAGFHAYNLEKDFLLQSHLRPPADVKAARVRGPLGDEEADIIFSRQLQEHL